MRAVTAGSEVVRGHAHGHVLRLVVVLLGDRTGMSGGPLRREGPGQ